MAPLLALIPFAEKLFDRVIPDPVEKQKALAELQSLMYKEEGKILATQMQAIVAEAQGESWLQRNWRPVTMLSFVGIIVNNYILVPYFSALFSTTLPMLDITEQMWSLLNLGIGGYIAGRTAEKIAVPYMESRKGNKL